MSDIPEHYFDYIPAAPESQEAFINAKIASEAGIRDHFYGRLNRMSLPERGWRLSEIEDLGIEATHTCERCANEQIRYVFYMTHTKVEGSSLMVGCVCAGWMCGDMEKVKELRKIMEADAKKAQRLREKFINGCLDRNKGWKNSISGNPVKYHDDKRYFLFRKNHKVKVGITCLITEETEFVSQSFDTEVDAAGFIYDNYITTKEK